MASAPSWSKSEYDDIKDEINNSFFELAISVYY